MTGTRRTLFRFWIWLLAAAVAALAGTVVAIDLGRRDANVLRTSEAPARQGVAAAGESLRTADTEAINSFAALQRKPEGEQTGDPGLVYQSAIAEANQQLTQVSQSEIDDVTAEKVQVVTGLLIRYQGLIQDAFRGGAGTVLAQANMRWAHRFMEEEVLSQLATLEQNVEDAEMSAIPWWRHLLWVLPLAAFLGLLGWVQVWHSRRFRRTLSAPLLAASLLAMALGATAVVSLRFDGDVDRSRDTLDDMVDTYEARAEEARFRGCDALKQISGQWPGTPIDACPRAPEPTSGQQLLSTANSVSNTAASAATYSARATAAAVAMAVLAGLAVTLGLLPRLEEYRYQR